METNGGMDLKKGVWIWEEHLQTNKKRCGMDLGAAPSNQQGDMGNGFGK